MTSVAEVRFSLVLCLFGSTENWASGDRFDTAMSTPRVPSPSLTAIVSGTIEPQLPIKLDQTLTPGVYRIVNSESSNVAIDLSGYDKSSILGELRLFTQIALAKQLVSLYYQPTRLTRGKINK